MKIGKYRVVYETCDWFAFLTLILPGKRIPTEGFIPPEDFLLYYVYEENAFFRMGEDDLLHEVTLSEVSELTEKQKQRFTELIAEYKLKAAL